MHPNRSLRKTVRFLTVGGDAHIAPLGTIPERSEKTYTPVPPASGPMKGIGPYEKTVRFLTVGGDAYIAPLGTATEWSEKTYMPVPPTSGPMWASAPTKKRFVSPL